MMEIAVLVSGGGTNLQALIDRIADGSLQGVRICCVIASREGTFAATRADRAGIPNSVLRRGAFIDLESYDAAMLALLEKSGAELLVLAGFLSLLGPAVVHRYHNRILNIHPSLLPSFGGKGMYGLHVHEAVLASGAKWTGATVQFVNEAYDEGPILLQQPVRVRPDDTPESLQARVMAEAEQILLPEAVRLISLGRVHIDGHRTIIDDEWQVTNSQEEKA